MTEYIPIEPSIVAKLSDMPRSYTGTTSDQTGSIPVANADEQERRRRHVERVERAVNRLGTTQRRLIQLRYLDDDGVMDFSAAQELGYSDRHYRRIKSLAIYRLASILGLIVFEDDDLPPVV